MGMGASRAQTPTFCNYTVFVWIRRTADRNRLGRKMYFCIFTVKCLIAKAFKSTLVQA